MLEVLPDGVLLDPFVGGGTTMVEAVCSGREAGCRCFTVALFTTTHHTWRASDAELHELRQAATEAIQRASDMGEPGRCGSTDCWH